MNIKQVEMHFDWIDQASELGIELKFVNRSLWTRVERIGMHLFQPNENEFFKALESAERDLFETIFIYQ